MSNYVIALYIRLSIEDFKTESLSIPNQRSVLRERAMSLSEWETAEVMEFVDNGYSGTNFERPAIQELLERVQEGGINCIIVKDLSRFGRNSIETGYFIERVFPLYHVRFISMGDNFDTTDHKGDTGGIDVAFKYLINESYSRDLSMKVKSAKYAKMRRGEYQSVACPYGYRKSADGRMEPDGDTAEVVRQIFKWAAEGDYISEIIRKLYALHTPTPGEYKASKGNTNYDISRTHGIWDSSTVLRILKDERYIGTYVMGKCAVKEIGGTRLRLKDESEWFKIPDHHPAIVSRELFECAKKATQRCSSPTNRQARNYLLRGKVFCGCCDHVMSRIMKPDYFYCRISKVSTDLPCHDLQVRASELEQAVFQIIQTQVSAALGIDSSKDQLELQTVQQAEHEKKLLALQDSKRLLYEQYAFGEIDLDTYKARKAEYDAELVREKNVHAAITAQAKQAQSDYESKLKRQDVMREISSTDHLTDMLVEMLIKKVYVFPGDRIEIEYTTKDLFSAV